MINFFYIGYTNTVLKQLLAETGEYICTLKHVVFVNLKLFCALCIRNVSYDVLNQCCPTLSMCSASHMKF